MTAHHMLIVEIPTANRSDEQVEQFRRDCRMVLESIRKNEPLEEFLSHVESD